MTPITLFERLGGAASVDAIVGALYVRVEGDPQLSARLPGNARDRMYACDVALLVRRLGGPDRGTAGGAQLPAGHSGGLLLSGADGVHQALRDVLWLVGVSSGLVDEVLAAIGGGGRPPAQ